MTPLVKTIIRPHQGVMLPPTGYLRLWQIIGRKPTDTNPGWPALIPVCSATVWAWVKAGKFPKPVRLGTYTIAWRVEDIRHYMERVGGSP